MNLWHKGDGTLDISLYDFYKYLKNKNILFSYSGPVSQKSLEGVGNSIRHNLEYDEATNKSKLSVFSIFVEQVQNILNYSAEKLIKEAQDKNEQDYQENLRFGVIVIGRKENEYYVYCGNKIFNQDIPSVKTKIEEVRNLNKDELKALYKNRRRQEPEKGSKGAGLGMIEMARRAGGPLEYHFTDIDDEVSFFSIKVMVRR